MLKSLEWLHKQIPSQGVFSPQQLFATQPVQAAIEAVGARVEFLSPCSPDFNPIENCWSKIKECLRAKQSRTYKELDQAITEAINLVSDKDITGWFTHCCYYVPLI